MTRMTYEQVDEAPLESWNQQKANKTDKKTCHLRIQSPRRAQRRYLSNRVALTWLELLYCSGYLYGTKIDIPKFFFDRKSSRKNWKLTGESVTKKGIEKVGMLHGKRQVVFTFNVLKKIFWNQNNILQHAFPRSFGHDNMVAVLIQSLK